MDSYNAIAGILVFTLVLALIGFMDIAHRRRP